MQMQHLQIAGGGFEGLLPLPSPDHAWGQIDLTVEHIC
jgi:hypothetical protein